mmetsp:Transcript_34588/g.79088  ORF Transcript_34588/g.79088 Transcript_34588/m.79088 type:complete len:245 (-) Transcript_34588:801-1535(-)
MRLAWMPWLEIKSNFCHCSTLLPSDRNSRSRRTSKVEFVPSVPSSTCQYWWKVMLVAMLRCLSTTVQVQQPTQELWGLWDRCLLQRKNAALMVRLQRMVATCKSCCNQTTEVQWIRRTTTWSGASQAKHCVKLLDTKDPAVRHHRRLAPAILTQRQLPPTPSMVGCKSSGRSRTSALPLSCACQTRIGQCRFAASVTQPSEWKMMQLRCFWTVLVMVPERCSRQRLIAQKASVTTTRLLVVISP